MKRLFFPIVSCCLVVCLLAAKNRAVPSKDQGAPKITLPRIAIAGLGIESSTFSPALTSEEAFHAKYGNDVFSTYPFLSVDSPLRNRAVWIPTLVGHSLPGGAVTRDAYESLVGQTLDSLAKNGPYDGLYFDIHGAMSVVGLDDPEGDFIVRIRQVIGKKTIISTSMDLHGNVSWRLAENTDLITCYRMAPHEDAMETKQRAVENLLERIENGKGKPAYKVWIPIPILLPGEKTSTRIEPAKSVYKAVAPAAAQKGVIDAAIWVGYAWADEPRNHAVVMVTGDDKEKVTRTAEQLARNFWNARDGYAFVAPTGTLEECLGKALSSDKHPYFISDCGDNPTAGGAGDVTWTLQEILARPEFKSGKGPALIYASIPGPELVKNAIAVGIGGHTDGYAGAKEDARYAPPVRISGTVESIEYGDKDAEVEVAIRVGSVHVIVTRKRKPYHKEGDFTRLGLHPREAAIVVVKIGYLEPELYAMKADWMMALTPGGVDQDLERLPYKRIERPMFPLDKNIVNPDLSARIVPSSGQDSVIPANLQVPAGNQLIFHAYAKGVQIYRCAQDKTDTSHYSWTFIAPEANLYADAGYSHPAGRHYAGPAWESTDGTKVVGAKLQQADSPDPAAIPWLLLRAASNTGSGVFGKVTFIQRVNTKGGKAPSTIADGAHKGQEVRIPYTAEYFFFSTNPVLPG